MEQQGMASAMLGHVSRAVSYSAATLSERMAPGTIEFWVVTAPFLAYWVVTAFYELLDSSNHPAIVRHRVTRKQPGNANQVTRTQVFVRVILQQLLQTILGMAAVIADPQQCPNNPPKGLVHSAIQFIIGMFVMDTWQYWIHRAAHVSTFLYKHVHSTHHRLLITYAMGALYNHPLEALFLDTLGAGVSMYVAGMSCQLAAVFFTFSTIKTVLDHSSYRWPLNPLHGLFPNNAAYHDVHHDIRGIKKNFSQPYFIHWDHICGTFLDPADFHLTQAQLDAKLGLGKAGGTQGAPAGAGGVGVVEAEGRLGDDSPSGSSTSTVLEQAELAPQLLEPQSPLRGAAPVLLEKPTMGVTTRSRARHTTAPQM